MRINRSAVLVPVIRNRIVRSLLDSKIEPIDSARVVIVRAPAGWGKTSAMSSWREALEARGRTVLWISPRSGIRSVEDLMATIEMAGAASGVTVALRDPATFVEDLLIGLEAVATRPVLMIDDTHMLAESAVEALIALSQQARDAMTVVLASRGAPVVPVARLRPMGYLVEIGEAELALSVAECAQLLSIHVRGPVDMQVAADLADRTSGWIGGATLALRSLGKSESIAAVLNGHRPAFRSYFEEEVLRPIEGDIRAFMTEIAVLDTLTAAACSAVSGRPDSKALLDFCVANDLFVRSLDDGDGTYRLHPLLSSMLRYDLSQRDPEHLASLHRRAATHFITAGERVTALHHAVLGGDTAFLGDILEAVAETLTYEGSISLVVQSADTLPWATLSMLPMTLLTIAWFKARRLSFTSAEALIDAAERCIGANSADASDPAQINLHRLVRHRRFVLAAAQDNMPLVEREAEALLAEFGDDNAYLSCTILAQLMSARRELYHFHDALKLQAETRRALARSGSEFASIAFKSAVAPGMVGQGRTAAAVAFLEEALATAESIVGAGSGVAALPALPLAEILYDQGDLPRAAALIDAHMGVVREWGFVDQMLSGYVVRVRLMVAENRLTEALAELEEAHLTAIECGLDRLRAGVIGEQVRLLLQTGDVDAAHRLFASAGFDEAARAPSVLSCRRDESVAIAWIRLEMRTDNLKGARRVARHWREFVRRSGAVLSSVRFELLLAEIAVLAGDRCEARRAIREAVTLAAPSGWIRPFIDEGEIVTALLLESYGNGPILEGQVDQFAQCLVRAIGGPASDVGDRADTENIGMGGRLVAREAQILTMVGGGLRNREIGDRLGLTEGTVKWYMQQIYDKLGVRRRPQAVMRARQLGMLA